MFNSFIHSTVSEVELYIFHHLHTQHCIRGWPIHCSSPPYTGTVSEVGSTLISSSIHSSVSEIGLYCTLFNSSIHSSVSEIGLCCTLFNSSTHSCRGGTVEKSGSHTQDHIRRWTGPQSTQSAGPGCVLIFCSISIILLASLVAGRRSQYTAGAVQQEMYSIRSIHQNIKSAPASLDRSRVGPALYVFSLLGQDCTEIYNTIHKTVSEGGLKNKEGNAVICSPVSENGL
jgi:hypothetical protein